MLDKTKIKDDNCDSLLAGKIEQYVLGYGPVSFLCIVAMVIIAAMLIILFMQQEAVLPRDTRPGLQNHAERKCSTDDLSCSLSHCQVVGTCSPLVSDHNYHPQ